MELVDCMRHTGCEERAHATEGKEIEWHEGRQRKGTEEDKGRRGGGELTERGGANKSSRSRGGPS